MSSQPSLTPQALAFLARHSLKNPQPLPSDASARRYWRLPETGLLLMQDESDPTGFAAFLRISAHLLALGLSAPRVHAQDASACLALIEDWGDATYTNRFRAGADEATLYGRAVEALLALHHAPRAAQIDVPAYDRATWRAELELFCDWFAPQIATCKNSFTQEFLALWEQALTPLFDRNETLVLRDFHVDNLMDLSAQGHRGPQAAGLLDFQDAVLGPSEYDLVSLLQDARRDLPEGLEEQLLSRYISEAPAALGGEAAIRQRYWLCAAQRHARIMGVFVRLCLRDKKPHYLQWLARVMQQFSTAIEAAGLTEIAAYLDQNLPDWRDKGAGLALRLAPQSPR